MFTGGLDSHRLVADPNLALPSRYSILVSTYYINHRRGGVLIAAYDPTIKMLSLVRQSIVDSISYGVTSKRHK
jgi:hypothetical protein